VVGINCRWIGNFLIWSYIIKFRIKKIAGERLKILIDKHTTNPIKGVLVGFGATALMQSSTATTSLVIALVKAGLMSFKQASAVIIGANIGTTITAFIISLKLSSYAPFVLLVGAGFLLFARTIKWKHWGEVLFGFGALFFGLGLMEGSLKMLTVLPEFSSIISTYGNNRFLGVLVGTIGAAAVQSSTAFIGVLQALYSAASDNGTSFALIVALPILFGSNIGTTVTALLASIGGSISTKRAALLHFLFNLFGTIVCIALLMPINWVLLKIFVPLQIDPKMQLAIAHILFNLITAILILPLISFVVLLVKKIIRGDDSQDTITVNLKALNRALVTNAPYTALEIAKTETITMANWALQSIQCIQKYIKTGNVDNREKVMQYETCIDQLYEQLSDFLNKMRQGNLEEKDVILFMQVLRVSKDIERLGDHCENLVEFFDAIEEKGERLLSKGKEDILTMLTMAEKMVADAIKSYQNNDKSLAEKTKSADDELDQFQIVARERHLNHFRDGFADKNRYFAMVYVDILANIERIGDHAVNIVDTVLSKNP
jgi:phosphate:Na+ symporter